jgi:hypothetical protein
MSTLLHPLNAADAARRGRDALASIAARFLTGTGLETAGATALDSGSLTAVAGFRL